MRIATFKITALFVTLLLVLQGCGGGADSDENQGPRYLDSVFVDANYRHTLDALTNDTTIAKPDRESIRAFIRKFRKRIPEGWTYGKILEAAKGVKELRNEAIEVHVSKFYRSEVDLVIEINMELKLRNKGSHTIDAVYGDLAFSDSTGKRIHVSPPFSVLGPIKPGDSTQLLRLQYAYERPTGNALNDPKRMALRDTLNMLKDFAKHFNPKQISFRTKDILADGGLMPEDYFLVKEADRAKASFPSQKPQDLLAWVKTNETLVKQLANRDADKWMSVRPVLTDGYESQHGKFLMFDRRMKVVRFFTQQQDVPGRNIDPVGGGGHLESRHIVDYWGWPFELWVFAKER